MRRQTDKSTSTPTKAPTHPPLPHGYLFRRWRGNHLSINSKIPATIYLCYESNGKRHTLCLHTKDKTEAYNLAMEHAGCVNWTTRAAYLQSVIRLGEMARAELHQHLTKHTSPSITDMWSHYLASRRRPKSGPATLRHYEIHVRRFVQWAPQALRRMDDLTAPVAEQYIRYLEKSQSTSAASIRKHIATLSRTWRVLAPETENPWDGLSPEEDGKQTRYRRLNLDELKRLSAPVHGSEIPDLVLLGYYTGLRLSDAVSVRIEHYDRENRRLVLPPPAKTARRKPNNLIIPVLPELNRLINTLETEKHVFLFPRTKAMDNAKGIQSHAIKRHFMDCSVATNANGRASFHSLRATFISMMDEIGCPGRLTDLITNHAPRSMHERYSQPDIEHARAYMEKALPPLRETKTPCTP